MSNKLEAALGGAANEFTDDGNVVFTATMRALSKEYRGHRLVIDLKSEWEGDDPQTVSFWAEDAAKIIALIQEAAK